MSCGAGACDVGRGRFDVAIAILRDDDGDRGGRLAAQAQRQRLVARLGRFVVDSMAQGDFRAGARGDRGQPWIQCVFDGQDIAGAPVAADPAHSPVRLPRTRTAICAGADDGALVAIEGGRAGVLKAVRQGGGRCAEPMTSDGLRQGRHGRCGEHGRDGEHHQEFEPGKASAGRAGHDGLRRRGLDRALGLRRWSVGECLTSCRPRRFKLVFLASISSAMTDRFQLVSPFQPSGDQPEAIRRLTEGFDAGLAAQTLLGVTGSGKTFTIANVIERIQKPTIVLAPNKTLAAQLYGEFKEFFPNNAVEYFVSYYDYYQPEAYVVASDTFIEKDSSINDHIEQMRLAATKALLSRRDSLIVATVSAIYGLGDPEDYMSLRLILSRGEHIEQRALIKQLTELQYVRNEMELRRGTYRVRGEIVDVFPAESEAEALRIELFDGDVENL